MEIEKKYTMSNDKNIFFTNIDTSATLASVFNDNPIIQFTRKKDDFSKSLIMGLNQNKLKIGWVLDKTYKYKGLSNIYDGLSLDRSGEVKVNGSIKSACFITTSDKNLKDNIVKIENPIDKIFNLEGVKFEWKENILSEELKDHKNIGYIAQDVEKIFPELVEINDNIRSISYDNLTAILVEGIKHNQILIDNNFKRLKILEEKLSNLE